MLDGERERDRRVDAEEGAREQPAQRDGRRDPAGGPQRPGRQQRPQPPHEPRQAGDAQHRGAPGRVLPDGLQRRDAQRRGEGVEHQPGTAQPRLLGPGRQRGEHRQQQDAAEQDQWRQPEEDPPPARALGEHAGHERPDQRGHHPRRGDGGEDPRSQGLRVALPDEDVDRGDEQPAGHALHDAAGHELRHGRGRARDDEPGREADEPRDQRTPGAAGVAHLAGEHEPDDVRDQEAGERPPVRGQPVQRPRGGGQGGRYSDALEGDQGDQDDDADRGLPQRRREDRGGRLLRLPPRRRHGLSLLRLSPSAGSGPAPAQRPSHGATPLHSGRRDDQDATALPRDEATGRGGRVVRAAGQPLRLPISSVSCGATSNRSPTTPKSASSKIGASGSLLMATIVLDVCMPARCWMAPEMPTAM